jgi:formylglycine-generating enzyme required for sulfatase activity
LTDGISDDSRSLIASRQANAVIVLFLLGKTEALLSGLRVVPDTTFRSFLIDRLKGFPINVMDLVELLTNSVDAAPGVRSGLILAIGLYGTRGISDEGRGRVEAIAERIWRDDPDPGMHSSAEWLLNRWHGGVNRRAELQHRRTRRPDQRWFADEFGHTFVIIPSNRSFCMGSSPGEYDSRVDEGQHLKEIPRRFAISTTEISVSQFRRFLRESGLTEPTFPETTVGTYTEGGDRCPVLGITWIQAARYCRWLSEKQRIPEEQMCFPPIRELTVHTRLPRDYLRRVGYRLPTESEWELAARGGTTTPYSFGTSVAVMDRYARSLRNARGTLHPHEVAGPVGSLMPNPFGLFDVHGNVYEWCLNSKRSYPVTQSVTLDTEEDVRESIGQREWSYRGGSFSDFSPFLRSAYRGWDLPERREPTTTIGFRIARTLPDGGDS